MPPLATVVAGAAEIKFLDHANLSFPLLGGLIAGAAFTSLAAGALSPRAFVIAQVG
jgi:hypothetical protein